MAYACFGIVVVILASVLMIPWGDHDLPVREVSESVNQQSFQDPLIHRFSLIAGNDSDGSEKKAELAKNIGNIEVNDLEPDEAFKYQVYEVFNSSTGEFRGAGSSMSDFRVTVYNLIDDNDIADPSYMGHNRAIKATIVYSPPIDGLQQTLWGYEYDATRVAEAFFTGDLKDQVGFVVICFRSSESPEKAFSVKMSLNARDADRFGPAWDEDGYLCSEDWSSLHMAEGTLIPVYEEPDSYLVSLNGRSDSTPDKEVSVLYSDDNVRSYLSGVSSELMTKFDAISDTAIANDYKKMADKSNELSVFVGNSKKVISDLPVSSNMENVVGNYLSGLDEFRKAGSYYWYGATFGDSEMLSNGTERFNAGVALINSAPGVTELNGDLNVLSEAPSSLFPDALEPDDRYSYRDSRKANDISAQIRGFHLCSVYTINEEGSLKTVKCKSGSVFLSVTTKFTHLGYWGSGSSKIKTPKSGEFTLIYKGEEYHDITPKYYSTTLGSPYISKTIDRKENEEAFLLFEVPAPFEPESAYISLNLGKEGKPIWSLSEKSCV